MNVIATWAVRCDRRRRLLPLMGEFYWDTQCVLIASWSALDLHWQETSEAPRNSAPNWGKNETKMIICAKHTHTHACVHTDTHNRSRCFPLFAAALYNKKRKMLLLSNYERPRRDKWLWIEWLVSATQPASVLPYVANDWVQSQKMPLKGAK